MVTQLVIIPGHVCVSIFLVRLLLWWMCLVAHTQDVLQFHFCPPWLCQQAQAFTTSQQAKRLGLDLPASSLGHAMSGCIICACACYALSEQQPNVVYTATVNISFIRALLACVFLSLSEEQADFGDLIQSTLAALRCMNALLRVRQMLGGSCLRLV